MQDREKHDLFIPVYVAYLCQTHLQKENLTSTLLKIIEQTLDQNKFICNQKALTVNFIESLAFQNQQAKIILNKLITSNDFSHLDEENISKGLQHLKNLNVQTISLIMNSFEKCADTIQQNNLTFILHLIIKNAVIQLSLIKIYQELFFNGINIIYIKKQLSHFLQSNKQLSEKLKQRFLQAESKDKHLITEYKKNYLMDEQLLQSVELYAIDQNTENKLMPSFLIDIFFNITRLRIASEQFVQLVEKVIPSFYNHLQFSDYIKLLNSQMAQRINEEKISTTINQLITRIQDKSITLENETFQKQRLFYLLLQQVKQEYPGIQINLSSIEPFLTNVSQEVVTLMNQQDQSDSEEEKEQQKVLKRFQIEDSPYQEYFEQALIKLNIPFIREYRIGFYKIDIFLPEQNICIDLNGDLHYFNDKLTPPSEIKNRYLESLNYQVVTIRSSQLKSSDCLGFEYGKIQKYLEQLIQDNKQN